MPTSDQQVPPTIRWRCMTFESGSTVVLSDRFDLPHYRIGCPDPGPTFVDETTLELYRYDIAKGLEEWLNGGEFPVHLRELKRHNGMDLNEWVDSIGGHLHEPSVYLHCGTEVSASGPVVQNEDEDSAYARLARRELIEAIKSRCRPVLRRVPNPDIGAGEET